MKKNKKEIRNTFSVKEVIFLLLTTCIVSLIMGYAISDHNKINTKSNEEDKYLKEFIENYEYILDNYYENVDKNKLMTGAIDGMVEALGDTHSVSISNEGYFNIKLTGSYSGLGVQVVTDENNNIVVYNVISDSPAQKAGIQTYDIIKSIDGKTFDTSTDLADYIKESSNQSFEIIISRDNNEINLTLTRDTVTLKSVYSEVMEKSNKKIGYIYVSVFASNTASQFTSAVEELEKQNIDSLIIDVRDNTGGHLTSVVEMLSCLLDSSKTIYQIQIKDNITKYNSKGKITKTYPIVVLQNGNSASASELLSSALQEEYGATVIGNTSYGKGTVQELVKLSNGKEYKFTTKKWLTPKGNWINEKGVVPNIEVSLNDEYQNNPTDETDNQLQTALEYLTK